MVSFNNASRWQMGFNSAFKGLTELGGGVLAHETMSPDYICSLYQLDFKWMRNQEMVADASCQDLPQRQTEENSGI
jgi:hypothetical protein